MSRKNVISLTETHVTPHKDSEEKDIFIGDKLIYANGNVGIYRNKISRCTVIGYSPKQFICVLDKNLEVMHEKLNNSHASEHESIIDYYRFFARSNELLKP